MFVDKEMENMTASSWILKIKLYSLYLKARIATANCLNLYCSFFFLYDVAYRASWLDYIRWISRIFWRVKEREEEIADIVKSVLFKE